MLSIILNERTSQRNWQRAEKRKFLHFEVKNSAGLNDVDLGKPTEALRQS